MNISLRIKELRKQMSADNIDSILLGVGANLRYFTALPIHWIRDNEPAIPDTIGLITKEEVFIISKSQVVLDYECDYKKIRMTSQDISNIISKLDLGQKVGVSLSASHYLSEIIRNINSGIKIIDAEQLGIYLRIIKTPEEIEHLTMLAKMTDRVMEKVIKQIKKGVTQEELESSIKDIGLSMSAEDISFSSTAAFVKSNSTPSNEPFIYPKDKGLVKGTSIAFDFGFIINGYCSDFGRSFYFGKAPDHIKKAYQALQAGQLYLIDLMKPGTSLGNLFSLLENFLDERGYGDYLRARLPGGGLGHQIGIDLHEFPKIRRDNDYVLKPGMIMCLEPKLWHSGEYYLRVEDMVLITDKGAISLTKFDRELFELL